MTQQKIVFLKASSIYILRDISQAKCLNYHNTERHKRGEMIAKDQTLKRRFIHGRLSYR